MEKRTNSSKQLKILNFNLTILPLNIFTNNARIIYK